ncbi:ABC transporter permease [Kaistia dalseonensis]|uniref:Peptide/nickel transport system permease protein n=1 Tax=Kaistia dalseonensis TaxID=410840 RepID=A0ABU0H7E4_9HYPH|nr:ABC transporter permease [Kaistia dalseonensis]MCX5495639.1 ABC transporter permease [Kaistia dalseonensis]MDQ0438232.1 peptide/nickel transport system permease protein [Kaistia dalseonensis]
MTLTSVINRLGMAAITLFGVGLVVFVLLRVVPGDPIAMMISPSATPADIAALRAHYGLDLPLPEQFFIWLGNVVHLDFGTSISLRRGVLQLIGERLPATLELTFAALVFGVLAGGIVAVAGVLLRRTPLEAAMDFVNGLFLAVPDFVWALVLVLLVGVLWPIFPLSGRLDPVHASDFMTPFYLIESIVRLNWTDTGDVLAHLVMPMLALGLPLAAVIARTLKEALSEAMVQDYVLLARLKGMSELRLVLQEALRNAVGPTLTLTGVQFTFMIGGTVIVERIFAFPGIGNMAIDAVVNRDLPLIQGIVLVFGALFIVINIAVDLIANRLNPRQSHG